MPKIALEADSTGIVSHGIAADLGINAPAEPTLAAALRNAQSLAVQRPLFVEPYTFSKKILSRILSRYAQSDLSKSLEEGTLSYADCLSSLRAKLPDQDLFSYTTYWFPGNIPTWTPILRTYDFFNKGKTIKALDIGVWQGQSTCWIIQNLLSNERSEIHSIDTFEGSEENINKYANALLFNRFAHNIHVANGQGKCFPYKGKSHGILLGMAPAHAESFDFAYIDGSHTANDVFCDALLTFPLVKKGGLMFLDDYEWTLFPDPLECPKLGIDRFMEFYKDQLKVIKIGYQVYLEKI